MTITIDGKRCTCEKGEKLLAVARRNWIPIPTLCHHESLPGQASCRVCLVEVVQQGRSSVVASCVYPVEDGIEVYTNSDRVRAERGMVLALLRKRAPDSQLIADMCRLYGAPDLDRVKVSVPGKCILCGLCVRACAELSVGAISTVNRGVTKEIATPYHEPSAVCVGCGSCASVCPTGAIEIVETADTRTIWDKTFRLVRCARCGEPIGTEEELAHAARKAGTEPDALCERCRRRSMTDVLAATYGDRE